MTDLDLVVRILRGDTAAAERLFLRYREEMQRVASRILGGYANEAQLVQEAWQGFALRICKRAYRALSAWNGLDDAAVAAAGIGRYFAGIMRSAAHDVQREVMRRRRETDFGDDEDALIEHGTELDDGDLARMKALLALCLDALPPRQRRVFGLRAMERSHAEVAQAMAITENNSRQLFNSARRSLERCVENGGPPRAGEAGP